MRFIRDPSTGQRMSRMNPESHWVRRDCLELRINVGRDYLACSAARKQGVCSSTRGIRRQELDRLILDAPRDRMMDPELFAEFSRAFVEEWNRLMAEAGCGRDGAIWELAKVERKLRGLIEAVSEGFRTTGLQEQMTVRCAGHRADGRHASMICLAQLGGGTTTNSAAILDGSGAVPDVFVCSAKVVAGTRNHLDLLLAD